MCRRKWILYYGLCVRIVSLCAVLATGIGPRDTGRRDMSQRHGLQQSRRRFLKDNGEKTNRFYANYPVFPAGLTVDISLLYTS